MIYNTLNIDYYEYELQHLAYYLAWCCQHANDERELQLLLTYSITWDWFKKKIKVLECEYTEELNTNSIGKSTHERRILYATIMKRIVTFFPSELFPNQRIFNTSKMNTVFHEARNN